METHFKEATAIRERIKSEMCQLEHKLKEATEAHNKLINIAEAELKNKEDELKKREIALNNKENEIKKKESKIEKTITEIMKREEETKSKENQLNSKEADRQKIIADLESGLKKLSDSEGLSKVVGTQITDGNPEIADLSDLIRPTKLGEKYAELYDNEWTDAFEEIVEYEANEEEAIKRLLDTLKDVYKFCQNVSKEYANSIKTSALVFPGAGKDQGRPKTPQLTATSRKQIVELRKTFAPSLTEDAFKQYIKTLKQPPRSTKKKQFTKSCVNICWLMSIQDPPVVLDIGDPKGPFDGDKYRTYTKSGKSYDFIVWPPMRLHDAGPLLGKGVAQGK